MSVVAVVIVMVVMGWVAVVADAIRVERSIAGYDDGSRRNLNEYGCSRIADTESPAIPYGAGVVAADGRGWTVITAAADALSRRCFGGEEGEGEGGRDNRDGLHGGLENRKVRVWPANRDLRDGQLISETP